MALFTTRAYILNSLTQNTKINASDINSLISECNGKLNLSGGTITGSIKRTFTNFQTLNNILTVASTLKHDAIIACCEPAASDATSSGGLVTKFGGRGNTILGAGESSVTCMNELLTNAGESVYITADTGIFFYTNANTYANKLTFSFTKDGKIQTPTGTIWIA